MPDWDATRSAPGSSDGVPRPILAGRYSLARCLGLGTQAGVFLVEDVHTGALRALKVADTRDDARMWRFVQEARIMQRLAHPNVLRIHEVLNLGGAPAIVTELAEGGSVDAWLFRNGPMPPRLALEVALQCAGALEHAHRAGVLHRDVKPGNLVILADGNVALADFGTALCLGEPGHEGPDGIVGTPSFMAPEQRGGAGRVDARADVFGLGATLLRLCTAARYPDGLACATNPEVLDGIAEPARAVIRACCRYDRRDRLASMTLVRGAIEAALARCEPLPAGTPPLAESPLPVAPAPPPDSPQAIRLARLEARLASFADDESEGDPHTVGVDSASGATIPADWDAAPARPQTGWLGERVLGAIRGVLGAAGPRTR